VLGLLIGAQLDDSHVAESTVAAKPVLSRVDLAEPQLRSDLTPADVAETVALAQSVSVTTRAEATLGRSVDYSVRSDEGVLIITGTASARAPAIQTAQAVADALIVEAELRADELLAEAAAAGVDTAPLDEVGPSIPELVSYPVGATRQRSPDPVFTGLLGALAGLGLSMAWALFSERRRATVSTADEIERETGVPVLTVLPTGGGTAMGPLRHEQRSDATRRLHRTMQRPTTGGAIRLLILDTTDRADAGVVAAGLAVASAVHGDLTVAIDGDPSNPTLDTQIGTSNEQGWSDLITGALEPADVAVPADHGPDLPLRVIPAGAPLEGRQTVPGAIRAAVGESAYGADLVIISGPDATTANDLADLLDASLTIVLSVTVDHTLKVDLDRSLRLLAQHGRRASGLVVHGGPPPHASWPEPASSVEAALPRGAPVAPPLATAPLPTPSGVKLGGPPRRSDRPRPNIERQVRRHPRSGQSVN